MPLNKCRQLSSTVRAEPKPQASPAHRPPRADSARGARTVALLIETSSSYGRGILRGIARFNRERGRWFTYLRPSGLPGPIPEWILGWRGHGILARVADPKDADRIAALDLPIVNLRLVPGQQPFPYVGVDNREVASLALGHFRDRGLKHFGFCGVRTGGNVALAERGRFFGQLVAEQGGACHTFTGRPGRDADWEEQQAALTEWIGSLPKPIGIMACNDERGLDVLDACRRCGVAVPDDVSVIGVDNDEPLCELSIPPLTSIDVNADGIGYEAAAMLDAMMSGREPRPRMQLIPPRGVVRRRSTDAIAGEDPEVARSLAYIHERALSGLQVAEVVAHVGLSRASLQRRMKQVMGRTIHEEIQRVRLARARELLTSSQLTIKQIARDSGFSSVQYMTRVFRAATGETPARYRARRAS